MPLITTTVTTATTTTASAAAATATATATATTTTTTVVPSWSPNPWCVSRCLQVRSYTQYLPQIPHTSHGRMGVWGGSDVSTVIPWLCTLR